MNYILKNENLKVTISDAGAEILSIINEAGDEVIHQGCDVYADHCPICFPTIGIFPDSIYSYNGMDYKIKIHGFASSSVFEANQVSDTEISFKMSSNEETLKVYPFRFDLFVNYTLKGKDLTTEYVIKNTGNDVMYYSVGSHTGYKLDKGLTGYRVKFQKPEDGLGVKLLPATYHLTAGELIKNGVLQLDDTLFKKGCFTLTDLSSDYLILEENNGREIAKLDFSEFKYVTFWSVPGNTYVCIEPWSCESAHYTDSNILDKQKDFTVLQAGNTKTHTHTFTIY